MRQIISNYTFNPAARTVTFTDLSEVHLERLALITNVSRGVILFSLADATKGALAVNNAVTLMTDTTAMSSADDIRIDYDTPYGDPAYDRQVVGNARSKFRDGFATFGAIPDPATWDVTNTNNSHFITRGGNSFGSAYLRISLSPFKDDSEVTLTSKQTFSMPMRVGFGISVSQRVVGQEVFIGMVAANSDGSGINLDATPADKPITGVTAAIATNVATFTLASHGLNGGDRVTINNCPDSRLNVSPVIVTIIDANTFTVPCVLANGSYSTVGGVVQYADPLRFADNGTGLLFESATLTAASFVSRRNGTKFRSLNSTVASTTALQSNVNPYTDAFNSAANHEMYLSLDEVSYRSFASDGIATMSGIGKYTQGIPDENPTYKIHVRARTGRGFTLPMARITSIAKTGTTIATVTTDVPHGLVAADFVQIYGVRDIVSFPALAAMTAISSIIDATHFTVVIGAALTVSSTGGAVWKNVGSLLAPGVLAQSVQAAARTAGVMTLTGNTTWATPVPGEFFEVYGMSPVYDGPYKVLRVLGTILELEAPGPDFISANYGGALIRRTDVRLHFARVMDYTRLVAEISGGRGNTSDVNNAVPVAITGGASLSVSAAQTTGVATTQWSAAGWGGFLVADIPVLALSASATTAAVIPGIVGNVGTYAHSFNCIVTIISGASAALDLSVEESPDNGINWIRIFDFPRITAVGTYTSPRIPAVYGTRYRYVQTVTGTTPSITRAVNRIQFSNATPYIRRFVDRSVVLTTLNSTTPTYDVDGSKDYTLGIKIGSATTPPQIQLQGTEDETATGWYDIGATLTAVANSYVALNVINSPARKVRAIVEVAGVAVTADYVTIKAMGY